MEGTSAAADLLGPGIGGFLIGLAPTVLAGAALAYLIDSLSYLVSVFGLAMIRTPFQGEYTQRSKVALRQEIMTGFRFLWTHIRLRFLTLLSTCVNLFVGSTPLAVIILARNELHIPVLTLGLIFTVGGIGGIIGAIFVPWLKKLLSIGQILISSLVLWSVSLILLALAPFPLLLIVGWIIFTLASPVYFATSFAYRVILVPDELQGRVNGIYRTFSQAGYALGVALIGLLLNLLNARQTLWLIALGLLLSLGLIVLTELRHA
jgi:MFS family permease